MKLSIMLRTADYRGDHAADVWRAVEPVEGETIEQLVARCGIGTNQYATGEVIEIRLMEITKPEQEGK